MGVMSLFSQAKREEWAKAHPLMLVTVLVLSLIPPGAVVLFLRGASFKFSIVVMSLALVLAWGAGFAELRARGRSANPLVRSIRRLGGYQAPGQDNSKNKD
jgi:hypothetical protein